MRRSTLRFVVAMLLLGYAAASAQDAGNGQRLSERGCAACHPIGPSNAKSSRSFASIAAKPGMTSEIIASYLMLPHATMPSLPLKQDDAQDIAAYIMKQKK